MRKVLCCLLVLAALTWACQKSPATGPDMAGQGNVIVEADLLHHRYVLVSVDGQDFAARDKTPDIEFNEGFRLSGGVCNRFIGQGELKDGRLYGSQLAFTRMLCLDEDLNALETVFAGMLTQGAALILTNNNLTLQTDSHVLVYKLSDWVQ